MTQSVFKYLDLIGCDLFGRAASNIRVTGDAMRSPQWRPAQATRLVRLQARIWAESDFDVTAGWLVICAEHELRALQGVQPMRGTNPPLESCTQPRVDAAHIETSSLRLHRTRLLRSNSSRIGQAAEVGRI
ncbi:hypothetical protein [Bradyrhizobium embrapense]